MEGLKMFSIYDGRTQFYQWDKNQKLIVDDESIEQVHFANCLCANARVCDVYTHDDDFGGIRLVDVPNELLTENSDIKVWGYDGNATKHSATFGVIKRTKPADYIYTEEELKTWEKLYNLAFQMSEQYNQYETTMDVENNIEMLMDMPVEFQSNFADKYYSGNGTITPYNKRPLHYANSITLGYNTDYKEPEYITIDFNEPFYTGNIYWTKGYYISDRKKAVLDTSKLGMYTVTSNGVRYIGVRTALTAQGMGDMYGYNLNTTSCNALTYSTSPKTNYCFYIGNGYIYMFLKDELTENDNENLEKAKQILEGTEFYYKTQTVEKIKFKPMPSTLGAEADDDSWLYLTLEIDNDEMRVSTQNFSYRVRPGVNLQQYIYNDLSNELSAIYERLDELEANL